MSNKNYRYNSNDKFQQFDEDFEDYGYDVKNIRRQTKKKVTKFKTKDDDYYDTFWSGTLNSHLNLWWGIVYKSSRFHMKDIRIEVQTYDGCITIWYERSKLKNACDSIHNRVLNQLAGLNLKRVEVSVIWSCNSSTTFVHSMVLVAFMIWMWPTRWSSKRPYST